jgi:hypothetical protein
VEGLVVLNGNCDAHDWVWDPTDDYGCPVCRGISLEQSRIIALLASLTCNCDGECGMVEVPFNVLERLIKGENE